MTDLSKLMAIGNRRGFVTVGEIDAYMHRDGAHSRETQLLDAMFSDMRVSVLESSPSETAMDSNHLDGDPTVEAYALHQLHRDSKCVRQIAASHKRSYQIISYCQGSLADFININDVPASRIFRDDGAAWLSRCPDIIAFSKPDTGSITEALHHVGNYQQQFEMLKKQMKLRPDDIGVLDRCANAFDTLVSNLMQLPYSSELIHHSMKNIIKQMNTVRQHVTWIRKQLSKSGMTDDLCLAGFRANESNLNWLDDMLVHHADAKWFKGVQGVADQVRYRQKQIGEIERITGVSACEMLRMERERAMFCSFQLRSLYIEIIAANLGQVICVVQERKISAPDKYKTGFFQWVMAGLVGLMAALDSFAWDDGERFSEYATRRISDAVDEAMADPSFNENIPTALRDLFKHRIEGCQRLALRIGRKPTRQEKAEYLNLPVAVVDLIAGMEKQYDLNSGELLSESHQYQPDIVESDGQACDAAHSLTDETMMASLQEIIHGRRLIYKPFFNCRTGVKSFGGISIEPLSPYGSMNFIADIEADVIARRNPETIIKDPYTPLFQRVFIRK